MYELNINVKIDVSQKLADFLTLFAAQIEMRNGAPKKRPAAKENAEGNQVDNQAKPNKDTEKEDTDSSIKEYDDAKNDGSTIDFETLKSLFTSRLQETGKRDALKSILSDFNAGKLTDVLEADYSSMYERIKAV